MTETVPSVLAGIWSPPGGGERLWTMGLALTTIVIPGEAVDDRYSLMEFMVPRHVSPPLHTHPQDETFFMLEGTLTLQLGDDRFAFEPGATTHIPAGLKHTWRADTEIARWLVLSIPAGIDRLFRDLSGARNGSDAAASRRTDASGRRDRAGDGGPSPRQLRPADRPRRVGTRRPELLSQWPGEGSRKQVRVRPV